MIRMETRDLQEYRSHRDADSVDAQLLQTLNIVFSEPGLPMLVEDFVSSVWVRSGEVAVGLFWQLIISVGVDCD